MRSLPQTKEEHSPWALVFLLLAATLFGLFWLWQRGKLEESLEGGAPVQEAAPAPLRQVDLDTLEASTVNIAIPAFEDIL